MAKSPGSGSGKPLVISGTDAGESLTGGRGNDYIYGHGGNDVLRGGGGDDQIQGHDGDDEIFGEDGRDTLFGQHGHDTMSGGAGNDQLWGGTGQDTLTGGGGADTFNFARSVDSTTRTSSEIQAVTGDPGDLAGKDTIRDFSQAQGDRIDISRIDALNQSRDGFNDNSPFTVVGGPSNDPGTAWIVYDLSQPGHATIYLNQDGGETAEFQLEVYGDFTTLVWGVDVII
jgi:Ca2+-binding RTX toxin-like protein